MDTVRIWTEKTIIPTYPVGEPEKNPAFLEQRVYQGSSGRVYPYPVIETVKDEKIDQVYQAVFLENEYLKVMVLPELGGRIQRAFDKTNGYDFVYYNHVIKPALVGLTGPWISGGIEFNWPQHHRPTTFLPVDFERAEGEDGSKSVLLHDVDQMYGTKALTKITLYPGKAYIEITGQLYNRTPLAQTFLWWANPAFAVNSHTQSIFPPDVHAVMDHGKRDVSRFPIATGIYYKTDYSEGVDISRYKNIPVPTSYMAEKSKYDFVGGYDYGVDAGLLHVADHRISPGKKQWTWGCGDFGRAWDRNLTDEDGPYIELMTGVYTDNQPDFSWLAPFEEKTFQQYFMPYKGVGEVKNASKEAVIRLHCQNSRAEIAVYVSGRYENARLLLTGGGRVLLEKHLSLSPESAFITSADIGSIREEELALAVYDGSRLLVRYQPDPPAVPTLPEPAKAAKAPSEIMTNEELFLTAQHLEQYRHAVCQPEPYYLEGLKRDPGDIRINCAYGMLMLRRGRFETAEAHFRKALQRLTALNPSPSDSEAFYGLGLALFHQSREEDAYDAFYKASWSSAEQEMAFYWLAVLDARAGHLEKALAHLEKALVKNAHHIKARGLKAWLLRKLGRKDEAACWIKESLMLDPFDFVSGYEQFLLTSNAALLAGLKSKMRDFSQHYLMTARDYGEFGGYEEALGLLETCSEKDPMCCYYQAYFQALLGRGAKAQQLLVKAEGLPAGCCFPNKLEDIAVLRFAIAQGCSARAPYYLGCLFYDKQQWEEAVPLWEGAAKADPSFPTVWRNLALAYYNKQKDGEKARKALEKAFSLDPADARVFLELDQLYKKLGQHFEERLERFEAHPALAAARDDLYIEWITLLNAAGRYEEALEHLMGRHFHPWEGGEGKAAAQYTLALTELAKKALKAGQAETAGGFLRKALTYPENLGEGKLAGTKDNHIYYYLGLALKAQGQKEEAANCFKQACIGTDEPAGVLYYNDQPADMILYQGLAFLALGRAREARARFYRLIDYGERHLDEETEIPYFSVSLPDFVIFDEDYTKRSRAHCRYLIALGSLGLGDYEKAIRFFDESARLEPSHQMCRIYQQMAQSLKEDSI